MYNAVQLDTPADCSWSLTLVSDALRVVPAIASNLNVLPSHAHVCLCVIDGASHSLGCVCDTDEAEELPMLWTRSLFYIQTLCIDLHSSVVRSIWLHQPVLFVCCNQYLEKKNVGGGGTATSSIIGMDAGSKIFFYSKCILYAWKPTLIRINEAPCLNLIHCLIHPWYLLTCGV